MSRAKHKDSFFKNAFPLSIEQMRYIKNNYPAFTARVLSEKAKKLGAWSNYYGCGMSASSSAVPLSSDKVYNICCEPDDDYWISASNSHAASWVAFYHIFNPASPLVKSIKQEKYTATVWMPFDSKIDKFNWKQNPGSMEKITSEGWVGTFGGKKYLIVNYEEAVKNYEKDNTMLPMLCAEVGSCEKAVPISLCNDNDISRSIIFDQYERILFEDATEEEKLYVIPTEFECEMIYGTPCYTMKPVLDLLKKEAFEVNIEKNDEKTPALLLKTLKRLQELDEEMIKKQEERIELLKIIKSEIEKDTGASDDHTK